MKLGTSLHRIALGQPWRPIKEAALDGEVIYARKKFAGPVQAFLYYSVRWEGAVWRDLTTGLSIEHLEEFTEHP